MKTHYYLELRIRRGKKGQHKTVRISATTNNLGVINNSPYLINRIKERAGLKLTENITVTEIIEWRKLDLTPIALK